MAFSLRLTTCLLILLALGLPNRLGADVAAGTVTAGGAVVLPQQSGTPGFADALGQSVVGRSTDGTVWSGLIHPDDTGNGSAGSSIVSTLSVASGISASPGDTITLPVYLKGSSPFAGFQATVNFDPAYLTYLGTDAGWRLLDDARWSVESNAVSDHEFRFLGTAGLTLGTLLPDPSKPLVMLRFKVRTDAPDGSGAAAVGFSAITRLAAANGDILPLQTLNANIAVANVVLIGMKPDRSILQVYVNAASRSNEAWGAGTVGRPYDHGSGPYVRPYGNGVIQDTYGAAGEGAIFLKNGANAAYHLTGEFWSRFFLLGATGGRAGWPAGDRMKAGASPQGSNGIWQRFDGLDLYLRTASDKQDVRQVEGAIRAKYAVLGGTASPLGFPFTDQLEAGKSPQGTVGVYNVFEGGHIHASAIGAFETHGAVDAKYVSLKGTSSVLGFPISDELPAGTSPKGTNGRYNLFEGGAIHATERYGAHPTWGAINTQYVAAGGSAGYLGFPTSDPYAGPSGVQQDFEGGSLFESFHWLARDIAVGPDNLTRVLWTSSDGRAALWVLDETGTFKVNNIYGPYIGWHASALAVAGDGQMRVLWNNNNGQASFWKVGAGSSSQGGGGLEENWTYGPYDGWQAVGLAAGPDNKTRALWVRNDGAMALWMLRSDGSFEVNNTYGPYSGWWPLSIAVGSEGKTQVLWSNVDGSAAFWQVGFGNQTSGGGALESNLSFGPYGGWNARRMAVGADGKVRALWTNVDGEAALWLLDGRNQAVNNSYGPYAGWTATGLAVGADNKMRALWTNNNGSAALWRVAVGNQSTGGGGLEVNLAYGPY